MNRLKALLIVAALGTLVIIPAAAQKNESARAMLEAAKQKQTLEGDLAGAIRQYQAIVDKYSKTDRAAAADALVAMAACYQKQGDTQGRKLLERVIREFADQKDAVAFARTQLGEPVAAKAKGALANVQLWRGSKVDTEGTVSPDGRYLSYVDWDTGDLALHDFATGEDRRLTNKGTWAQSGDFAEESTLSPDGTQVAYSWYTDSKGRFEVRIMRVDGAPAKPRTVFDNPDVDWLGPYHWSPDGKWLAVALARKDRTQQLGLLNTTDGSLKILKSGNWRGPSGMFFSPDGASVAYDIPGDASGPAHDVFVRRIDGSEEISAVVNPATDVVMGWSPDGRFLLFASDRSGSMGLWSLSFANGRPQGAPSLLKDMGNRSVGSLGITRSGSLLYGLRVGAAHIEEATIDFQTGKVLVPPKQRIETYSLDNRGADWSRDGKYLAYTVERPGNRNTLFVESVATGVSRELPVQMRLVQRPRWTPDGAIIVQGTDTKGQQGIYRLDPQTGSWSTLVSSNAGITSAQSSVSPDGKRLIYRRTDDEGTAVVERDLASGSERELVRRRRLVGLSLSPDGKQFTFIERDPTLKSSALFLMPVAGGAARELFRASEPAFLQNIAEWTPDGQRIVFMKNDGERNRHWIIPSTGGTPVMLELETITQSALRIHPDGRRAAFNAGSTAWEVWVLENFLPATTTVKK